MVDPTLALNRVMASVLIVSEFASAAWLSTVLLNVTLPVEAPPVRASITMASSVSVTALRNETASPLVLMSAPRSVAAAPFCVNEPSSVKWALLTIVSLPALVTSTEPPSVVVTVPSNCTVPAEPPPFSVVVRSMLPFSTTVLWNRIDSASVTVNDSNTSPALPPTAPMNRRSRPAVIVRSEPVAFTPSSSSFSKNVAS